MANHKILITGCQRSGTTLMHLILDSHPMIHGVDETAFRPHHLGNYWEAPDYHPAVSLKLPMASHEVHSFARIPGLKVVWCLRDPRDVVLSMINLNLPINQQQKLPWAVHPAGAIREILSALTFLGGTLEMQRQGLLQALHQITSKPLAQRNRQDGLILGAICWRLKQELLEYYQRSTINHTIARYETLVINPKQTLEALLQFLDMPWDDKVLNHHQLHSGQSIGNTDNTRQIDERNIEKWKTALNEEELAIISTWCGEEADRHGYDI